MKAALLVCAKAAVELPASEIPLICCPKSKLLKNTKQKNNRMVLTFF
jgi:hypothetical protein